MSAVTKCCWISALYTSHNPLARLKTMTTTTQPHTSPAVQTFNTDVKKPGQLTVGDFEEDVVKCVSETLEQGAMLAGTLVKGAPVYIVFHRGKQSWAITDERLPLSQQFDFGSLFQCARKYERTLGVTLPSVRVVKPGYGIFCIDGKLLEEGPWRLMAGKRYALNDERGNERHYVAKGEREVVGVAAGATATPEALQYNGQDPLNWWSPQMWLSLREVPNLGESPDAVASVTYSPT